MTLKCFAEFDIRGSLVPSNRVVTRPMNFGQRIAGQSPIRYMLTLPVEGFCERIGPKYRQYIQELRDDVRIMGSEGDETLEALIHAGWPSLEGLLSEHFVLASEFLREYMAIDILDSFTHATIVDHDYVINSFGGILTAGDRISIYGECYEMPKSSIPDIPR